MKKRSIIKLLVPTVLLVFFFQATWTNAQKETTATTQTKNGLHVTKFSTPQGDIAVYFPGDASAGDRISGTVISEPVGENEKKLEKNRGVLEGYVFEMEEEQSNKTETGNDKFQWVIPAVVGEVMHVLMKDPDGTTIASAEVPVMPEQPEMNVPEVIDPGDFTLPEYVQSGMPASVSGFFDGVINNTSVTVGHQATEILAESPRQCTFMAPENITGITDIELKENKVIATGKTNSLDLKLTADKLNLTKGESTTIHLEITGLDEIQQPVPYEITNYSPATVNLSGGNEQTVDINPEQVEAGGVYHQDFSVSAINTGSFSLVAQVSAPPPPSIILVSPEEDITPSSANFLWTSFNLPQNSTYTLKIWNPKEFKSPGEMEGYQVNYDVLDHTAPYFTRDGIETQSFDYSQAEDLPLKPNNLYVWQVTGISPDGNQVQSGFENVFCNPAEPKHITAPKEFNTMYVPTGYVHITTGKFISMVYDNNKYQHITKGKFESQLVPSGYKHITVGDSASRIYPDSLKHITSPPKQYSTLIPTTWVHITTGKNPTSYYDPKTHYHLTYGKDETKIVPKGYLHITSGKSESKIYPGNMIHQTGPKNYTQLIPKGYSHITSGKDKTLYKPDGKHIETGPDKTSYEITVQKHIPTGKKATSDETVKKVVKPVEPTTEGIKDPDQPVQPSGEKVKKSSEPEKPKTKEQIEEEKKQKEQQEKEKEKKGRG